MRANLSQAGSGARGGPNLVAIVAAALAEIVAASGPNFGRNQARAASAVQVAQGLGGSLYGCGSSHPELHGKT